MAGRHISTKCAKAASFGCPQQFPSLVQPPPTPFPEVTAVRASHSMAVKGLTQRLQDLPPLPLQLQWDGAGQGDLHVGSTSASLKCWRTQSSV